MAYEMKELSGSLFKNDKKLTDSHPNAKGSALINGVEYWVSAWTKKDKNGNAWQSLAFQAKDAQASRPPGRQENEPPFRPTRENRGTPGGVADFDDEVPY